METVLIAINSPNLEEQLKTERGIDFFYKKIFYREGILEMLEKNKNINRIIIDSDLPGEIEINKLIEKIIEINKKIKIIITIKKENKNKIKINNKKIKIIIYEKNINLNKIIYYKNKKEENNKMKNQNEYNQNIKNNFYKKDVKKNNKRLNKYIKNEEKRNENIKSKERKIIFFGDCKAGKSVTIIIFTDYIIRKIDKNAKILIIDSNKLSPSIYEMLKSNKKEKKNKKGTKDKVNIKNKHNKKFKGKFFEKYIDKKIIDRFIIKLNNNVSLISNRKIFKYRQIEKIEKNFDYIFFEINIKNKKIINRKIINKSYKNILLINPNLIGIKNSKKIIKKYKINKKNNLKIIINNYNKYSIDEKIIKNIFPQIEIIGKIKYSEEYEKIINNNFKNIYFHQKSIENNIKQIVKKTIN